MKVLFVGQPYSESSVWSQLQIKALRQLGCEVTVFDERLSYLPGLRRLPIRVSRRLKWRLRGLQAADAAAMNRALLAVARQAHPDLLLACKATQVTMETVQQIGQLGVVTANWFPDDLQHFDWIRRVVSAYTHFFSFDTHTVSLLQNEGARNVHYLPLACAPALHRTVALSNEEWARYTCDVAFVGAPYQERVEALRALSEFGVKIWGYDGWLQTDLARSYQGTIHNGEPLVRLYNACRIAVNIHWKSAAHGANYRTFEVAGCGAFQIADARADIPQLFEPGREIVLFDSPGDLKEKVSYYLKHEDERRVIARAGQARAYRDHTVRRRMQQLLESSTGL